MVTSVVRDRVARGALVLDAHAPSWRDRLNVDALDVASVRRCPVGQTFGLDAISQYQNAVLAWRGALVTLGAPSRGSGPWADGPMHAWAVDHGFDSPRNEFTLSFDWVTINDAWHELLAR